MTNKSLFLFVEIEFIYIVCTESWTLSMCGKHKYVRIGQKQISKQLLLGNAHQLDSKGFSHFCFNIRQNIRSIKHVEYLLKTIVDWYNFFFLFCCKVHTSDLMQIKEVGLIFSKFAIMARKLICKKNLNLSYQINVIEWIGDDHIKNVENLCKS